MNAALYGLLGVALGGGLALLKDSLIESHRDKNQRAAERRRELKAERVAALLLADELDSLAGDFKLLADLGRSLHRPITDAPFLPPRIWHQYGPQIAQGIDQLDTWKALASLYHNAESLRTRLIVDGPNAPIPPERLPTLRQHAADSRELSEIVYAVVEKIDLLLHAE